MGNRLLSLDLVKLVAMLGVICLHTECIYYDNPISQFLYMTAVVSIPLFFMNSGYLLYGKTSIDSKYSCRKIIGIIRFILIITMFFWLLQGWRHEEPFLQFTLGSLLQKGSLRVFWYFGAMIILYSFLPFFHHVYNARPILFWAFTALLFFLANGIFIANFVGIHLEQNTIQTFRLWNWIFYFNVGGLFRRYKLRIQWRYIILLILMNYMFQYYLTPMMPNVYGEFFYSSIPIMLLSISFFSYLLNINNDRLQLINGVNRLFLPVYVIHMFVIGKIYVFFDQYIYSLNSYTSPLLWLLASFLSIILAWLIMRVPYMDKVFRI